MVTDGLQKTVKYIYLIHVQLFSVKRFNTNDGRIKLTADLSNSFFESLDASGKCLTE